MHACRTSSAFVKTLARPIRCIKAATAASETGWRLAHTSGEKFVWDEGLKTASFGGNFRTTDADVDAIWEALDARPLTARTIGLSSRRRRQQLVRRGRS